MEAPHNMQVTLRRLGRFPLCACLMLVMLAASARAAFPIEDMDAHRLGLQYGLAFRGENITKADIPSHETIHTLGLAYAPIPYLSLEGGLGLDKLAVESDNSAGFSGDYGFSPTFGLVVSSPYFLSGLVRVTAGARGLFLNSEDSKGFRYSGLISSPFLGAAVSPSGYFDLEAGARWHWIDGTMQGPGGIDQPFANKRVLRGYASATIKSPADRAFLTVDADVSPGLDSDWSHGPREAQVGISFGALLGWAKPSDAADSSRYFPDFPSLRERQKKMAGEIQ